MVIGTGCSELLETLLSILLGLNTKATFPDDMKNPPLIYTLFSVVLGFEFRVSHPPGRRSVTRASALVAIVIFQVGLCVSHS